MCLIIIELFTNKRNRTRGRPPYPTALATSEEVEAEGLVTWMICFRYPETTRIKHGASELSSTLSIASAVFHELLVNHE